MDDLENFEVINIKDWDEDKCFDGVIIKIPTHGPNGKDIIIKYDYSKSYFSINGSNVSTRDVNLCRSAFELLERKIVDNGSF